MSFEQVSNFVNTVHHDTYDAITPDQWDLHGRVVLITGATRGIGRANAVAYARAGVSGIIITGRSLALLDEVEKEVLKAADARKNIDNRSSSVKVLKVVLDVTNEAAVEEAARQVNANFERLDILVNNAGYMTPFAPIHETQPDGWNQTCATNITGTFLLVRAFIPLLTSSEDGLKIIANASSIASSIIAPYNISYAITKFALLRLTELIEVEYSASGILPIAYHPGAILTDMGKLVPGEYKDMFIDSSALAADSLVWLTKERRDWLSGRFFSANWDVVELEAKKDEIVNGDKLKVRMVV